MRVVTQSGPSPAIGEVLAAPVPAPVPDATDVRKRRHIWGVDLSRVASLVRTTTFRLAMLHAALFILFAAICLAYLYYETAGHLQRQAQRELNTEFAALAAAYRSGGFDRLNQSVIERSSARGRFFYLLTGPDGAKTAGDFDVMPAEPLPTGEVADVRFAYSARTIGGAETRRSAQGRISRLIDGGALLVAYDVGEQGDLSNRVGNVVWRSAIVGLVLSLIGGALISRSAARRAEELARTTEDVMAGDLSRRAPVRARGDEFDRLSERLNAMLSKLERLMIASRHAGDAIAHDLRSPLTRLRNRLEGGLSETSPEGRIRAIETSIEDVDGVLDTFNAILRLSRVQGGASGAFKRINASAITDEIAELFQPVCEESGLSFDYRYDGDLYVNADRDLVAQAMANLMDNAIKYTPQGGHVQLRALREADGGVCLSVSDSGPGVPEEDRERVIERFVRLEQSRTKPGSGLGLSLASAVAEAHGGRLTLSDGVRQDGRPGLKVALFLPAR
ncbi:HAMP domain-containing protein [bacterium]|nr:HAMP domain-containing protein [bacterium]